MVPLTSRENSGDALGSNTRIVSRNWCRMSVKTVSLSRSDWLVILFLSEIQGVQWKMAVFLKVSSVGDATIFH